MKKILFIFMLFVSVFMTSCFEDDLILNTSFLDMEFEEKARLRVEHLEHNDVVRWRSSDEFVVSVNRDGVVIANHVGAAYISAFVGNKELICEVIVDPIINLYQEPILAFGRSKEYILNEEWRELKKETFTTLWFYDRDVDYYMYLFKYNKLESAGVTIDPRSVSSDNLSLFLDERYQFVGDDGHTLFFERDYFGIDVYTDREGIRVVYFELASRSSTRSSVKQSEKSVEGEAVLKEVRELLKAKV